MIFSPLRGYCLGGPRRGTYIEELLGVPISWNLLYNIPRSEIM